MGRLRGAGADDERPDHATLSQKQYVTAGTAASKSEYSERVD
jgi:hypothetical protein